MVVLVHILIGYVFTIIIITCAGLKCRGTARVAQGALLVAAQSISNTDPDLFLASYILDPAGLSLLLLSALGFLGMA